MAVALLPASAWANAPLGYFLSSHGPAARSTMYLGWVFGAISVAVCVIVAILLLIAVLKKRPKNNRSGIGREGDGLSWIYIGTGISTVVLFGMTLYMLIALNGIARPSALPGLTVTATGYDWWWKFDYDKFTTANELHIPVGVPVLINLKSADVVHAFWVPLLAGKTQMIPGQENQQWIEADKPGRYRGQCTQYCGLQHAHMAFEVVADTPDDFRKWEEVQLHGATAVSGEAEIGQDLFVEKCGGCHMVRGTEAAGMHAPDLTHVASRNLIAAGLLQNNPDTMIDWVQHVQTLKPGSRMPDFALSPSEAAGLKA